MASHTNTIDIRAPLTRAFAYIDDPRTLPDWMVRMDAVQNVIGTVEGAQ
jgi:hypothetical protein